MRWECGFYPPPIFCEQVGDVLGCYGISGLYVSTFKFGIEYPYGTRCDISSYCDTLIDNLTGGWNSHLCRQMSFLRKGATLRRIKVTVQIDSPVRTLFNRPLQTDKSVLISTGHILYLIVT